MGRFFSKFPFYVELQRLEAQLGPETILLHPDQPLLLVFLAGY